jgi:hypothetical protein
MTGRERAGRCDRGATWYGSRELNIIIRCEREVQGVPCTITLESQSNPCRAAANRPRQIDPVEKGSMIEEEPPVN